MAGIRITPTAAVHPAALEMAVLMRYVTSMAPGYEDRSHLEEGVREHFHQVRITAGEFHDGGKTHNGEDDADEARRRHALGERIGECRQIPRNRGHDQPARQQGQPHFRPPDDGGKRHDRHNQSHDVKEHRHAPFGPFGLSGITDTQGAGGSAAAPRTGKIPPSPHPRRPPRGRRPPPPLDPRPR